MTSVLTAAFWSVLQFIDVYGFAVIGAIAEAIWLPMLGALVFLPVVTLTLFIKDKFNIRSLYLYSFFILAAAILFLVLFK
jgi:hypothetical protein